MSITQIKGNQILDGTITGTDIDDSLEKDFTKVRVTTGDSSPDFLSSKIVAGDNITIAVVGVSGSVQYLAISGSAGGGAGSGTITGVTAGTGLSGGGVSGNVTLSLSATGSQGTYGSASQIPVLSVNDRGIVTSVTNTSVQIAESQVTNLVTDLSNKASTSITFSAGTGLTGGGDLSTNRSFVINDSIVATVSGTTFTGTTKHNAGLSGSLTRLIDGTPYLIAGSNVVIFTGSNGAVTIASTGGGSGGADPNAQYLVLSSTGSLSNERTFSVGAGLTGTDGGANSNYVLNVNDSVVATISGTQFTGPISSTGFTATDRVLITSGSSKTITQANALVWDSTNQYLGIGTTPSRNIHVATGFRLGSAGSYIELVGANSAIARITPGGTLTTLEMNQDTLFPPNKTIGFQSALAQPKDSGFSRAAAGIISVSGSAPGAIFRFNAASTPLIAGDLGMNTTTGRPNALIGGSVRELAHTAEIAPLTSNYIVTSVDATLTNERVLAAGSGISIVDGGAGGNITISASGGSGALTLVETKTLSATGSVTFSTLNGDTDKTYFLEGEVTVSSGANIEIHPNGNSGTVMTGAYITNTSGAPTPSGGALTKLSMPAGSSVSSGERLRFSIEILADSRGSTFAPLFQTHCINDATAGGGAIRQQTISNAFTSRSAITSLKVFSTGGNMTGRVSLFKRTP